LLQPNRVNGGSIVIQMMPTQSIRLAG
jgi:hypothetical protein